MPKMAQIVPLDSIYILQRLVLEFLDDLIFWVAFECFDLRTKLGFGINYPTSED